MAHIVNITVVGVGLIGGSFALAAKKAGFKGNVVGCDSPTVLAAASSRGAIDRSVVDPIEAAQGSQLVVLATPIKTAEALLAKLAPTLTADVLITDVGSTKQSIVETANKIFGPDSLHRFLPGHPIAGKELSGIEHASADLFRDAPWVLAPQGGRHALIAPELSRSLHPEFIAMIEQIGARIVITTPEKHDHILAFTSHLPQLVSTALASTVRETLGDTRELADLSGRALREMVRLAKSDPEMWAAIAKTNNQNISEALSKMEENLAALRRSLSSDDFKKLFSTAREFDPDRKLPSDDFEPPTF